MQFLLTGLVVIAGKKVPQTRDISLQRSGNSGHVQYPGTDSFCMKLHLDERLVSSLGPHLIGNCGGVLLLRIRY